MAVEDPGLWQRIVEGDQEGFETLFRRYSMPLARFVRFYVPLPSIAEDMVQETFLELWKHPNGFDPQRGSLKQYMFGIARRRAALWNRKRIPLVEFDGNSCSGNGHADQALELNDALEHLSVEHQVLLWLREVEGYSYSEIAEILEVPLGTIKSGVFYAREELRFVWTGGIRK